MNNLQVKEGETLFVSAAAGAVGRYSSDCAPLLATPLM
jgi:NADPH-dependent curcumin reductase CurA